MTIESEPYGFSAERHRKTKILKNKLVLNRSPGPTVKPWHMRHLHCQEPELEIHGVYTPSWSHAPVVIQITFASRG